jgi:hypothetical protein
MCSCFTTQNQGTSNLRPPRKAFCSPVVNEPRRWETREVGKSRLPEEADTLTAPHIRKQKRFRARASSRVGAITTKQDQKEIEIDTYIIPLFPSRPEPAVVPLEHIAHRPSSHL